MANYYGTNVAAEPVTVGKSSSTRIVRAMWVAGWYAVLKQTVETETKRYEGLSLSGAESLCVSSETSTLNGVERSHLGGATVRNGDRWMHCDDCWGTRKIASMSRISPHMYAVDVTTETLSVSAGSGTLERT